MDEITQLAQKIIQLTNSLKVCIDVIEDACFDADMTEEDWYIQAKLLLGQEI